VYETTKGTGKLELRLIWNCPSTGPTAEALGWVAVRLTAGVPAMLTVPLEGDETAYAFPLGADDRVAVTVREPLKTSPSGVTGMLAVVLQAGTATEHVKDW
jgi:hypothetical protein